MEKKPADVHIPTFYANRSIFVTGATGFIGKALIEKLLRSCPDVAEIFVLIRPKKGSSVNDRLKKMLDNKLFDLLRSKQPSSFAKIIPVTGNISAKNLGLLPSDRDMLMAKVSIIFHIAATVRFDEGLKDAILNNARSTRDVCILAENMKQLVVLLHVSSTYSHTDKHVLEEILYPSEFDYKKTIEVAESIDDHVLRIFTAKYLGTMPNTYTFSKRLAEEVISDYSKSLPCVIIRPSIVISTLNDPLRGWIDNFNGPVAMLLPGGKGILRIILSDPFVKSDYMPVDATVKAMIIIAWKRGIRNFSNDKITDIYNCSSHEIKHTTVQNVVRIGLGITKEVPLDNVLWKPETIITKSNFVYYIFVLLLHIMPALFLDAVLKLFGARPMLLKLQRKIYVANKALSYFMTNEWKFINTKLLALMEDLSPEDLKDFAFSYTDVDIHSFFKHGIIGSKLYLLNENMDNLEAAKRHYRRMEWLDTIIKMLCVIFILWLLYRNTFFYITDTFLSLIR